MINVNSPYHNLNASQNHIIIKPKRKTYKTSHIYIHLASNSVCPHYRLPGRCICVSRWFIYQVRFVPCFSFFSTLSFPSEAKGKRLYDGPAHEDFSFQYPIYYVCKWALFLQETCCIFSSSFFFCFC